MKIRTSISWHYIGLSVFYDKKKKTIFIIIPFILIGIYLKEN